MGTYGKRKGSSSSRRGQKKKSKREQAEFEKRSKASKEAWKRRRAREAAAKAAALKAAATRKRRKKAAKPAKKTPTKRELAKENKVLKARLKELQKQRQKGLVSKKGLEKELAELSPVMEKQIVESHLRVTGVGTTKHFTEGQLGEVRDQAFERMRENFRSVLADARRAGKIPTPGEKFGTPHRMDSMGFLGFRLSVSINEELSEESLPEIIDQIDRAAFSLEKYGFPIWYAIVVLASYGRKLTGPYDIRLYGANPDGSFDPVLSGLQTQGVLNSGAFDERRPMVKRLESKLAGQIDDRTVVQVLYATIHHYRPKTLAEVKAWKESHP